MAKCWALKFNIQHRLRQYWLRKILKCKKKKKKNQSLVLSLTFVTAWVFKLFLGYTVLSRLPGGNLRVQYHLVLGPKDPEEAQRCDQTTYETITKLNPPLIPESLQMLTKENSQDDSEDSHNFCSNMSIKNRSNLTVDPGTNSQLIFVCQKVYLNNRVEEKLFSRISEIACLTGGRE